MRPARIVALVIGCLLVLPGLALLLGGGALGLAHAFGRDDEGYFEGSLDDVETDTVALTATDLGFDTNPGNPGWLLDRLDADVRLRVTPLDASSEIFVGIARERDVDDYLVGTAHDEVTDIDDGRPVYRPRRGDLTIDAPTEQDFWDVSASGPGTQEIVWRASDGRWSAVVMNADGSPGVGVDVEAGLKSWIVLPLSLSLLAVGAFVTAGGVGLIVAGAHEPARTEVEAEAVLVAGTAAEPAGAHPVRLTAELDPQLSRGLWLVKWFLAIPHFIVLVFLWIALVIVSVVAGFAILFTGRYPRGIFDFSVGVLRWTWRVSYYATTGGIGTDRYPPFSLGAEPEYPAQLEISYPGQLSRGLVLVKWWLLAIPHYLVLGVLLGTVGWVRIGDTPIVFDFAGGGGLLGLLVLFAGVALLFTATYPRGLFDLILGLNRWLYRVIAYVALMTDTYPPFRLDQGGEETTAADAG